MERTIRTLRAASLTQRQLSNRNETDDERPADWAPLVTVIVVGSAPCFASDLRQALQIRPFAAVMLINGACTLVEKADYVLAGHTEKAELFAAARRKAFPNAAPWQLHATIRAKFLDEGKREYPSVTHWHGPEAGIVATSLSKAVKIGFNLGYEEVILCGAPLDGSGYAANEATVPQPLNCLRIGDPANRGKRIIERYISDFKSLAASEFKGRVFSLSGFTRQCLGAPC